MKMYLELDDRLDNAEITVANDGYVSYKCIPPFENPLREMWYNIRICVARCFDDEIEIVP